MRLNVCVAKEDIVDDNYTNLSYFQQENCIQGNYECLDGICEDNECKEIVAPSLLDYVHISNLGNVVNNYVSKLRRGGVLKIGGTNLSHLLDIDSSDVLEFNKAAYTGSVLKQGIYSPSFIGTLLGEKGLKVNRARVIGNQFLVEAERV